MAQSVSNISVSLPLQPGSGRIRHHTLFSNHLKPNGANVVKAMAGEARENLDHLQRATKPKKRVAPVAPVGLWDRFPTARTVQQMMDTMESLIEDPFEWSPPRAPSPTGGYGRGRTPWEIKEGEGEYKMRFDMPGMTRDDVRVWVEEKMLVVEAEKEKKSAGENAEEEWSEKSYGRYSCRIALPENVEFDKIKAEVRDGVLYIDVPKANGVAKVLDINVM